MLLGTLNSIQSILAIMILSYKTNLSYNSECVSFKKAQRPIINDFLHSQTVDQCSDIQRTEFCQNNQKLTSVLSLMKTQDEKQKY